MKLSEIIKLLWKNRILFIMTTAVMLSFILYIQVQSNTPKNETRIAANYIYKVILTEKGKNLTITDYPIEKDKLAIAEIISAMPTTTVPEVVMNSFSARYTTGYISIKFDFTDGSDASVYAGQLMALILKSPNYNPYFTDYYLESFTHKTFDLDFFNNTILIVNILSSLTFSLIIILWKGCIQI